MASGGAPSMPTASRYQRIEFSPLASGSRQVKPAAGAIVLRPLPREHRKWSRTLPNRSHQASEVMNACTCSVVGMPGLPANRRAEDSSQRFSASSL